MTFNLQSRAFTVSQKDLEHCGMQALWAIQRARVLAGVPLGRREHQPGLSELDHLEKGIIDMAKAVGIDLGADWGWELDVSRLG